MNRRPFAPTFDDIMKMSEMELAEARLICTDSVASIDTELNDYAAGLRLGTHLPDADWERRAKYAMGRHRRALANINNRLRVLHVAEAERAKAEADARRQANGIATHLTRSQRGRLNNELFHSVGALLNSSDADFPNAWERMRCAYNELAADRDSGHETAPPTPTPTTNTGETTT